MGSPMVFQTAPPQPASKARITWPPVLVGGPEASQKGFGELRPQKLTVGRTSITSLTLVLGDDGTSFTPRQISQITTASMPSQPMARTAPASGCRDRGRQLAEQIIPIVDYVFGVAYC